MVVSLLTVQYPGLIKPPCPADTVGAYPRREAFFVFKYFTVFFNLIYWEAYSNFYPDPGKSGNPESSLFRFASPARFGGRFLVGHAFSDAAFEGTRVNTVFPGNVGQT